MFQYFIVEIGSKVSELLPSSIILKIFSKHLTLREQWELVSTSFNLVNILSSLALETGTVNNNLIINSTSLQPLPLGAVKVLHYVTMYAMYETPARERVFFAYTTNSYHCSKRPGVSIEKKCLKCVDSTLSTVIYLLERINFL